MYQITTRATTIGQVPEQDAKTFTSWVWNARQINCFDADVLKYPRSIMLTADDQDGPVIYMPVQPVLMLESLAPRPGVTPRKEALALWKLGEQLDIICKDHAFGEQYFICRDQRVVDLCARHGFEKLEGYTILRKKVQPDIPKPHDSSSDPK